MRAIVYKRQSLDRNMGTEDEGAAVARQEDACRRLATERRWTVVEVITENHTSATNGNRPGFARLMAMVDRREVDVVIVWHVDRLVRKLTELEDVISRCERAGVRLATVSGDIDLATDAGRLVARILASVARGEIERKGARQRAAMRQRAEKGRPVTWSHRAFGYQVDKVTPDPREAKAVKTACEQLLSGGSLRSIAHQWQAARLHGPQWPFGPQPAGVVWKATTVRTVLLNPRIMGARTYDGEIVTTGCWPPLVDEPTWRAVRARLSDPDRACPGGDPGKRGQPQTLLSGLARCHCGAKVFAGHNYRSQPIYRCSAISDGGTGHVARIRTPIDAYVGDVVVERMGRPDAAELLVDHDRPDVDALRAQRLTLAARLDEIAAEFADDDSMPASMVRAMTEKVTARLAQVDADMAEAGRLSVLGPLVAADDARAAWDDLDLDRSRAVVDALMTITLLSPGRGKRVFDRATVLIDPKEVGA